ncbi:hypothetical protein I6E29_07220 [Arcanobacterium haemolyticum]|nr:hypothetical protein [Arcanobacterium haemolyticum]
MAAYGLSALPQDGGWAMAANMTKEVLKEKLANNGRKVRRVVAKLEEHGWVERIREGFPAVWRWRLSDTYLATHGVRTVRTGEATPMRHVCLTASWRVI